MRKINGSSISQYAIIIALVALALIPVFFIFGQSIYGNFDHFYKVLSGNSSTDTGNAGNTGNAGDTNTDTNTDVNNDNNLPSVPLSDLAGGDLGGTPDNPVKQCENNSCVIDVGEFVITGIPDNLNELVETSGSSAGTETLLSVVDQMIQQMDSSTPPETTQNMQELANLGHILADFENHVEQIAENCTGTGYDADCFHNRICDSSTFVPDPKLTSSFPTLDFSGTVGNQSVYAGRIGGAMHDYLLEPQIFEDRKDVELGFTIVDRYNKVMNDPNITDTQKAVVKEMYWQIAILGEEIDAKLWGVSGINNEVMINDPLTGVGVMTDVTQFSNEDIFQPKSSNVTDFDSAIICAVENSQDSGHICH